LIDLFVLSCVIVLVHAEARGPFGLKALAKTAASCGFVVLAVRGGVDGPVGRAVFAGLALSLIGDLALLSHHKRPFLLGLGAFLLAHVAYAVAFVRAGTEEAVLLVAVFPLLLVAWAVAGWLLPRVERGMRVPVLGYMVAICVMVAVSAGASAAARSALPLLAASIFFVSDLAVARDRFVRPGWINRAWGLPLYYAAQLLFARLPATLEGP
jgi:uncharacterized membrane protein YhhN